MDDSAWAAQCARLDQAAAAVLPGPLCRAFAVGLQPLRAVTLGDLALLEEWRHPLIRGLRQWIVGQTPDLACGSDELLEARLLWRLAPDRVRQLLSETGRGAFTQAALTLRATEDMGELFDHLRASFGPVLPWAPRGPEDQEVLYDAGVPEDGLGWWLGLYGLLLSEFHLSPALALDTPLAQALALQAWYRSERLCLRLGGPGYLGQEAEGLRAQAPG